MNCFNHRDRPAVGVCRSCGKGLCPECFEEVADRIVCKDKCRRAVLSTLAAFSGFETFLSFSDFQSRFTAFFELCLGIAVLVLSVLSRVGGRDIVVLVQMALGLCLIAIGIVRLISRPRTP